MKGRTSGTTKVPSGLGLGGFEIAVAGAGRMDEKRSRALLRSAVDHGIVHIDTARDYGNGESESVIGQVLHERADDVFIASKTHAADPEATVEAVHESLGRLRVDTIDLYYVHWPRTGFDLRPMMETLERLRADGVIRFIGVSNFSVADMESVSQVGTIDAHQMCYNLVWRYPERDVIPYCRENGIEIVTYSSIAQGLLSNTRRSPDSFEKGDPRAQTLYYKPHVWPHLAPAIERMQSVSDQVGVPLSTLAIQWVLAQPGVVSSLVGARSEEQLRSNIDAASRPIDSQIQAELTRLSDEAMRHLPDVGNIFLHYP